MSPPRTAAAVARIQMEFPEAYAWIQREAAAAERERIADMLTAAGCEAGLVAAVRFVTAIEALDAEALL